MFVKRLSTAYTATTAPPERETFPRNTQFETRFAVYTPMMLPPPVAFAANPIAPPQAIGDKLLAATRRSVRSHDAKFSNVRSRKVEPVTVP